MEQSQHITTGTHSPPSFDLLDDHDIVPPPPPPPPPYSPADTLDRFSPNPAHVLRSPNLLPSLLLSPKSPDGRTFPPPDVLVTPPSPGSVESFLILDNVAWARQNQLGGRRAKARRLIAWMCRAAAAAVLVAFLLAAAWGLVLWGLFGKPPGGGG